VRRRLGRLFLSRPVTERHATAEHDGVDILAEHGVDDALALEQRALGLGLAGCVVGGKSEKGNEALEGRGRRRGLKPDLLPAALELRLVRAVEDEEGVDGEREQAAQAVEKGSLGRAEAALTMRRLVPVLLIHFFS